MKYPHKALCVLLITLFIAVLSGCSTEPAVSLETMMESSEEASFMPDPSASLSAAPVPTVVHTIVPDAEIPPATTKPADEKGKVVIADGFYYFELNDEIKDRITGMSFPADTADCEITYDDLRYIRLSYYDFEGNVHDDGELIVDKTLAGEVSQIFYELYKAKYPFTSIKLVDDYGEPGDDTLSMTANNTSAFNYRNVTGSESLSLHSYGDAIDINPKLNPYIDGDRVSPANGDEYVDRSLGLPGMIDHDDLCYQLFTDHGWTWGGDWDGYKDYQHFSKKMENE